MRALQNLQKSKLKLLGTKCINIIEGPVKAVIILIRKTSDQIQMLVNILKTMDAVYNPCQLRKIHSPVDSTNSVRICGLYTDFQLDQPRTHGAHQFQFIFPQQICGNLKVEIGNSIIMIFYVLPDGHCMIVLTIKGSVHKFHLWHFVIQEKLKFFLYQFQVAKTQFLVHR